VADSPIGFRVTASRGVFKEIIMSRWICNSFRRYLVAAAVALGTCAGNAYAATFTFDDAILDLTGSTWTLTTNDWPTAFGTSAFIGSMVVDYSGNSSGVVVDSTLSGGGVTVVSTAEGSGPGGQFDFRFNFGSGGSSDRLTEQETVSWQTSGLTGGVVTNVALHLQGLNTANFPEGSLWLTPGNTPPIPEPSTYALFILGLIGLGFMMRKRLNRASPLAAWA
jgi:hypothetical protein